MLVLVHARTRLRLGIPFELESIGRRRQSLARGHRLNEADGDFSGRLPASRKQDGRVYTSEAARRAGAACLYGVHCRCCCSLIVKEKLNIFSLGLSPNLETEEKMWWGVGRGLDSAMRSRDDLRRQARTLFPGQRRRSRRANQLKRSAKMRKGSRRGVAAGR